MASLPEAFMCPITSELMADPVSTADGFSYEREAITTWLEEHSTSPLTNEQRELYFRTPYAQKFAATYETASPRSAYGLECAPRSVKVRTHPGPFRL